MKDNKLICTKCGSNRADKRALQTGWDGPMLATLCEECWLDFLYEFMD